jgi:hypothetical protein
VANANEGKPRRIIMTDLVEKVARALCWKNGDGMNPDLSLGGDKQNWLWYVDEAKAVIAIVRPDVLEEAAKVARMRRNYWDQKSNLHEASANYPYISADISCALSLSEECGDIAAAIRALG